jgi:hypothetical protein
LSGYYIDVPVIQGELITVNDTATGLQSESFTINDENIEDTYLSVKVNGDEWIEKDSFFISDSEDDHYIIENLPYLTGMRIIFGDNYRGKQLSSGDTLQIDYIQTSGIDGNITSINYEVDFQETYTYSTTDEFEPYSVSISQMFGGSDVEDIESIAYWGQKSANYMENFIASNDDLQVKLKKFGGLLITKAISEYDLNPTTPDLTQANRIKILSVPTTGTNLDDLTKTRLRLFLKEDLGMTDFVEFIDVTFLDIYFDITAEVFVSAPQNIATEINTYLQEKYKLGSIGLGESLDHSEVIYDLKRQFSDDLKRFEIDLGLVETLENPTINPSDKILHQLKLNNLRDINNTMYSVLLYVEYTDGSGSDSIEITDFNDLENNPLTTSVTDVFTNITVDPVTCEFIFTVDTSSIVSIDKIEFKYFTYDSDGEKENIDIKFSQIMQYGVANIDVEYLEQ